MITRFPKTGNSKDSDIFVGNIEELTLNNDNFRKVLCTTTTQQLVVMNIIPKQDIGMETHSNTTQFIRVESGECDAVLNDITYKMKDNDAVVIPPGTKHNIINTSDTNPLKLYTIYSPPEHARGTVQHDKPKKDSDDEIAKHLILETNLHNSQSQSQIGGCDCDRFKRIYNLNRYNYTQLDLHHKN